MNQEQILRNPLIGHKRLVWRWLNRLKDKHHSHVIVHDSILIQTDVCEMPRFFSFNNALFPFLNPLILRLIRPVAGGYIISKRSISESPSLLSRMSTTTPQWPAQRVRDTYLDFFKDKNHTFGKFSGYSKSTINHY